MDCSRGDASLSTEKRRSSASLNCCARDTYNLAQNSSASSLMGADHLMTSARARVRSGGSNWPHTETQRKHRAEEGFAECLCALSLPSASLCETAVR
jgi:hypothetical protein